MLKEFLMKKMLKSQMKGIPEAEQDKIIALVEKNPELFQKIALEVKAEMDKGVEQQAATMKIMMKYQAELKGIM